jgi:hypothetical protein
MECNFILKSSLFPEQMGNLHGRALQLLQAVHIHILLQQRNDVRVESLPVRVVEVVFLRRFLGVTLDDGEVLLVENRLHHEPREGFLIVRVNIGGFNKLGLELGDGLFVRLGAEVCCC